MVYLINFFRFKREGLYPIQNKNEIIINVW